MQVKTLSENGGLRTIAAILDKGDEVMECLESLAKTEKLDGAQVTAIGAFERAELYFFDWETRQYQSIPVDEQVEVASLAGDIGIDGEGRPKLHLHVVLGRRDGGALAGHLAKATVRPTLEVIVTETPAHLRRVEDEATGLALIRL